MANARSTRPKVQRHHPSRFDGHLIPDGSPKRHGGGSNGGVWMAHDVWRRPVGFLVCGGLGCDAPVALVDGCGPDSWSAATAIAADFGRVPWHRRTTDLRGTSAARPELVPPILFALVLCPTDLAGQVIVGQWWESATYWIDGMPPEIPPYLHMGKFGRGQTPWRDKSGEDAQPEQRR